MRRVRVRGRCAVFVLAVCAGVSAAAAADDLRLDLDRCDDPRLRPRVDAAGYSITVEFSGYLEKLQPVTIHLETRQNGEWSDVQWNAGQYLKSDFDAENPRRFRIESTLQFDLDAGERRFAQERDAIQREAQQRAGGKEAALKVRAQLLLERIAAIREENIKAGADRRGKATAQAPPLPRIALPFDKIDTLERILKDQCHWKPVADVFKSTGFRPPDDRDSPDFSAALLLAEETRKTIMGIKFTPRQLSASQYKALSDGSRYELAARFVPTLPDSSADLGWKTAPAVRLTDGTINRAALEGSLDRQRDRSVAWWRIECDAPNRVQLEMVKGSGDCFWSWVATADPHVRFVRLLLHSPSTRYKMNLSLIGSSRGEELIVYDGPFHAPVKGAF